MKGYLMLFLLTALLLLLFPLAALPRQQPTVTPPKEDTLSSATSTTVPSTVNSATGSTTGSTTAVPAPEEGAFRLLCGEEVITLSEREFLIRTLAFEMSPTYHAEALKAQAVAAYTYYGRRRAAQEKQPDETLKGADFATPDPRFPGEYTREALEKRWGEQFNHNYTRLCEAVDAVLGRAMTYEGAYIDACYFSLSNGSTESAETVWGADIPYLQAVPSPGDRLASDYTSTVALTPDEVKQALAKETTLTLPEDPAVWFGKPTLSAAGTVATIPVGDGSLPGTKVRQYMGLRSATFTVTYTDGQFVFTVHGYGHGVGMSQYGADYMARQGSTWEEILRHYYTGVTIV